MKKSLLYAVSLCCTLFLSTACTNQMVWYNHINHFAGVQPGSVYGEISQGAFIGNKSSSLKDVNVLGKVRGTAEVQSILGLFSFGDASIEAAEKAALAKYPEADDIINVVVDNKQTNYLSLWIKAQITLRGIAVKYKKAGEL